MFSNKFIIVYIYNHTYLKGFPQTQTTNEYLVPEVTGKTLCHINEGNITMLPLDLISFVL
tara:strand:+ start:572 stop:751 length:180 start_codon:yes stop_codon:yes gene_type:complete